MRRLLSTAAALLVACGGQTGAPGTPTATAAVSSAVAETLDARLARLYEAAKPEGKVALYSSMNTDDAKIILPKFEARFPGIKMEHTRATGEQLITKVTTEMKSGQKLFDVYDSSSFQVKYVIDQGWTQPYVTASAKDVPKEATDEKGTWIANRVVPLVIGFNTAKGVKDGDIKGWADLCDKKYEGKIAVEVGDVVVYTALRKQLGTAEAQRIIKCVGANKPSLRSGHTEIDSLLPAGEFSVTFASHSYRLAVYKYEQNKPVSWVRDPMVVDLAGATLAKDPPHPNAAKLFAEWIMSPEGQTAVAGTGRPPASTKVALKYPDVLGTTQRWFVTIDDSKDYDTDAEFWRSALGIK
jgi:iron(III) transport system substrate-binding protein